MPNRFSSGKNAIAACDICGQRYKLKQLRALVVKLKRTATMACPECWSPDHPQLQLGMFPVEDPQAVRDPRPDQQYYVSGMQNNGYLGGGSRVIAWGWNPVGGGDSGVDGGTPNPLAMTIEVGTVTVVTT